MLELKDLAEVIEVVRPKRAKEEKNKKQVKVHKGIYKLRELIINQPYNPRYCEEKVAYKINLEAKKAYHNLLN
ncbi:MAG: hypothetical protein ACW98D_09715 [Promethearchaeota archaeon]